MKRILIILSVFLFGIYRIAHAEKLLLKNGQTVEGRLIEKTDTYIKIDFDGVELGYFFDEIDAIDGVKVTQATDSLAGEKNAGTQESKPLPADKATEIYTKIQEAANKITRVKAHISKEYEAENMSYVKQEKTEAIDLVQKVITDQRRIVVSRSTPRIFYEPITKQMLEYGKRQGLSDEKILEFQRDLEHKVDVVENGYAQGDEVPKMDSESVVKGDQLFINYAGKKYSCFSAQYAQMWQDAEKMRNGSSGKLADLFNVAWSGQGALQMLIALGYPDASDIVLIEGVVFEGKDCYAVTVESDVNNTVIKETLKEEIAKSAMGAYEPTVIEARFISYIDKSNYQTIGSHSEVHAKISIPFKWGIELTVNIRWNVNTTFEYPKEPFPLPAWIAEVTPVQDVNKLQELLKIDTTATSNK